MKVVPRIALLLALAGALAASPAWAAAPKVAPADRAAIDRVLARFIPDAVYRQNPLEARSLASPELLAGTTKAQWAKGSIPVYPFAGRGTSFSGWVPEYVDGPRVAFTVLVHAKSKHAKVPQVLYNVVMRKLGGRWLVQSFYPSVIFGQHSITSSKDYAPGTTSSSNHQLGTIWFAIPAAVIGAVLAIPIVIFAGMWFRRRRSLANRAELPPLPKSFRRTT